MYFKLNIFKTEQSLSEVLAGDPKRQHSHQDGGYGNQALISSLKLK